mmetsp:Transcript_1764/g.5206  ORF Transcript_1764/g.5206 Transcript_1764/m.5206 type:complete len:222 (-) Transcript_1764:25-690(-)
MANEPARLAANDTPTTRSASADGGGSACVRKFAVTSSDLDSTMRLRPSGKTVPRRSACRPGSPARHGAPPATTIIRMEPQDSMAPPRNDAAKSWSLPLSRWARPSVWIMPMVLFGSKGAGGAGAGVAAATAASAAAENGANVAALGSAVATAAAGLATTDSGRPRRSAASAGCRGLALAALSTMRERLCGFALATRTRPARALRLSIILIRVRLHARRESP